MSVNEWNLYILTNRLFAPSTCELRVVLNVYGSTDDKLLHKRWKFCNLCISLRRNIMCDGTQKYQRRSGSSLDSHFPHSQRQNDQLNLLPFA